MPKTKNHKNRVKQICTWTSFVGERPRWMLRGILEICPQAYAAMSWAMASQTILAAKEELIVRRVTHLDLLALGVLFSLRKLVL